MHLNFLLLVIFIACIYFIYIKPDYLSIIGGKRRGHRKWGDSDENYDTYKDLKKHPSSLFEEDVRSMFQKLCGVKFPCVYPRWMKIGKHKLELDGYNKELGIAFEAQGPYHSVFSNEYDKTYESYLARITTDEKKQELAKKNSVSLIIVDYRIPKNILYGYIESRVFDICRDLNSEYYDTRKSILPRHLFFDSLPIYIPEQTYTIFRK